MVAVPRVMHSSMSSWDKKISLFVPALIWVSSEGCRSCVHARWLSRSRYALGYLCTFWAKRCPTPWYSGMHPNRMALESFSSSASMAMSCDRENAIMNLASRAGACNRAASRDEIRGLLDPALHFPLYSNRSLYTETN